MHIYLKNIAMVFSPRNGTQGITGTHPTCLSCANVVIICSHSHITCT